MDRQQKGRELKYYIGERIDPVPVCQGQGNMQQRLKHFMVLLHLLMLQRYKLLKHLAVKVKDACNQMHTAHYCAGVN